MSEVMEPFYNALHNFDINQVKITDPTDSLHDLIQTKKEYVFFKKYITDHIDKEGDILVGFYSEKDITFDVKIGNVIVATHTLKAGEFAFAFENTFIPLINISYHEVRVSSPVYIVCAHLDTEIRRFVFRNTYHIKNYSFGCGMFTVHEKNALILPTFQVKENVNKKRKYEVIRIDC